MAGILTSTTVMEKRYMLGEQRVMERLVGLGLTGDVADEDYERYWREQPKLTAQKKRAEAALEAIKQDKIDELKSISESNANAVAAGAGEAFDSGQTLEQRVALQQELIAELARRLSNPPRIPPRAMIPADVDKPADEQIRLSGQFDHPGEKVSRGFLEVLCDTDRPMIPSEQSGRIELAKWLMDGQHRSGQLTARVLANRVWYHLMGRGIVRTVDNFGRTGEPPANPELLDCLAGRLVDSDWSLKKLVRDVVVSRTFSLSSAVDSRNAAVDPDNQFHWRANRRRLDPESYRDALLSAADRLDPTPMDSTVWYLGDQATAVGPNTVRRRTDFACRSVYLPVIRNDLPDLFEAFDYTNPHCATGARPVTTAPTQALFVLNHQLVLDVAEAVAKRIADEESADSESRLDRRIDRMFQLILASRPSEDVRRAVGDYIVRTEDQARINGQSRPDLFAWTNACQALLASSRFQYLD
jgi:hypothetical protein